MMQRLARDYALLTTTAAIVFFFNLGGPRLWDRDEPRNAGCAREMMEAGDWVTPRFNAELRTHKPVMLYWLTMAAYWAWGVNEFAARFPSALLAVGTVLMTYHIGRRLFTEQAALWASVILASTLMFGVASRAATPDSVLIFFSTASLLVFVMATFPKQRDASSTTIQPLAFSNLSWPTAVLMYACMGLAVLAKGPVGLILPTAVVGMFLLLATLPPQEKASWWRRWLRPFAPLHFLRTCWRMRPITALTTALAVALPWYLLVHFRTDGEWTRGFFVTHNLARATTAMEGHGGPLLLFVLFYPVAALVGFFPWSVFAGPVLIDLTARLRKGDSRRWEYVFALCWVGVYIGLFSLAKTKLPSYITPMYPALALLCGCFIQHWTQGTALVPRLWPRLAFAVLALIGAGAAMGLFVAARMLLPGEEPLALLALLPLAVGVVGLFLVTQNRTLAAARLFAACSVLLMASSFGYVMARVDRHQHSDVLVRAIQASGSDPQLGFVGSFEPSWVFYAGRPIRPVGLEQLTDFFSPGRPGLVITTRNTLQPLAQWLPEGVEVIAEAPYFFKNEQLVLLGRPGSRAETVARRPD